MYYGKNIFVLCFALIALSSVSDVNGANILGLFTSKSPSHLIVHMSIMKALAEKGHNITVVTSLKPVVNHPTINNIIIMPSERHMKIYNKQMDDMTNNKNSIFSMMAMFFGSDTPIIDMQYEVLKDERFLRLYEPSNKFDMVIMGYFLNDFQIGVARKLNCPLIISWMAEPNEMVNHYVGNPSEASYVPNVMIPVNIKSTMTIMQRLQNQITTIFMNLMKIFLNFKFEKYYSDLFMDDPNFPSMTEMSKNVSLVFCNSHFSEGPIRPLVPAIVEIGGIQIKNKPDPLPEDIGNFLDKSKEHGAILFSLGSNLKASKVKPEIMRVLFNTLSSLKQNVIFKWDNLDETPGKSPNILYKKWMPQDDILAHPNLKLFITHAGKGGIAESQYHGVPMVGLPIFGDQLGNSERMSGNGYGLHLDFLQLEESTFKAAILEVITNSSYATNVKKYSQLYRDRALTAKDTAVYWTEYVIRHHGAAHMQSPLVHINALQGLNFDIYAIMLFILYAVWKVIKLIFYLLFKLVKKLFKSDNKKLKKH